MKKGMLEEAMKRRHARLLHVCQFSGQLLVELKLILSCVRWVLLWKAVWEWPALSGHEHGWDLTAQGGCWNESAAQKGCLGWHSGRKVLSFCRVVPGELELPGCSGAGRGGCVRKHKGQVAKQEAWPACPFHEPAAEHQLTSSGCRLWNGGGDSSKASSQ